MDETYWPDLSKLPPGWRLVKIEWVGGRPRLWLEHQADRRQISSTPHHRSPASAFRQALSLIGVDHAPV